MLDNLGIPYTATKILIDGNDYWIFSSESYSISLLILEERYMRLTKRGVSMMLDKDKNIFVPSFDSKELLRLIRKKANKFKSNLVKVQ